MSGIRENVISSKYNEEKSVELPVKRYRVPMTLSVWVLSLEKVMRTIGWRDGGCSERAAVSRWMEISTSCLRQHDLE